MTTLRQRVLTPIICIAVLILVTSARAQQALPIPPLDEGVVVDGKRTFNLLMQHSSTEFFQGVQTPTAGYNGSFLGPTLLMRKGDEVVLNVTNQLGMRTTTHWHGFHVPAIMDGGPHQMIESGETWSPTFTILNRASTFWYHPHLMPSGNWRASDGTGAQVYLGLAGMIIVEDDEVDALNLPHTYGEDEIPLIFTDRAFNPDGTFLEFTNPQDARVRKGTHAIVNGVITPVHDTYAQVIRFRLLNASNARIYYFGLSDNRSFYQIGSDGGLLTAPISLERLRLSTGERAEILIDFGADNGSSLKLMSYASELNALESPVPEVMRDAMDTTDYELVTFNVGPPSTTPTPVTAIPSSLISITSYDVNDAVNTDNPREFVLISEATMQINGVEMDINVINETVKLGDMEVWEIINTSGQAHPFHIHGDPFQVIYRSDGPVPDNEKGWKDVVLVPGRRRSVGEGIVRIIKPFLDFADPASPYMYHCHILEHEDLGMMGQFVVVADPTSVEEVPLAIPETPVLRQNYPNPFNPATQIVFGLPVESHIQLTVFDLLGRRLRVIADGHYAAGFHTVVFDADGLGLASGFYLYQLMTPAQRLSGKMLLLQ